MKISRLLDSHSAQQVIDTLLREQCQALIEAPALGAMGINGFLVSGDEEALLIEITAPLPPDVAKLEGRDCYVQLFSEHHYYFATTIRAVPRDGMQRALAVVRPDQVSVVERRLFRRATLAPSSVVELTWRGRRGSHRHEAALLNVSGDGLACRVEDDVAAALEGQTGLAVEFVLPWREEPYRLSAELCNRTPASEGCTILGLHFTAPADEAARIDTLRVALSERRLAGVAAGASK